MAQTRRLSVATGVLSLLCLAFVPEGIAADRLALMALITLGFASVLGWSEMVVSGRPLRPVSDHKSGLNSRTWLLVVIGVALAAGLAVQTWFKPGTSIGGGDILPPDGTAWLGRFFEPWMWTGSNLGEPSQLPLALPWAVVLAAVRGLGGDPAAAQRIFYTLLFICAALGALSLLAALRMGPVAASVGSIVYVFNPYVVSEVNTYAVYLLAVGLLAAIPAVLIATGSGRMPILWGAALVALTSPLLGYVFFNPPLLGVILAAALATPLLVAWIDGREAALRSIQALLLASLLLLATSAYWLVPAILHLSGFAGTQLVSLSTWTWTESRATLRNGFWLNAIWGWNVRAYYPYAGVYDWPLLKIAEFALPATSFGALALRLASLGDEQRSDRDREFRLAVAAATVAIVVIFISTGTNPPGNVIFNWLYNLPNGWLLREPGRFLILVALAYSVLSAVVVQALTRRKWILEFTAPRVAVQALTGRKWIIEFSAPSLSAEGLQFAILPAVLAASLLVGFPLYTGAVVPDSRPGLPPVHVHVPSYWGEMARFVDGLPVQGGLLVMPPDDFYQMPYSWGYYGSDGFIIEMFRRPVLVPNGQGYSPASSQVAGVVSLTAQSILNHNWAQAEALVRAVNTPLILVRRDVDATFPARSIISPGELAAALDAAPNFVPLHQIGALELYALEGNTQDTEVGAAMATVNTPSPDLRLLSLVPNTALVTDKPRVGVQNIVQAPPLEEWQSGSDGFLWKPNSPPGWSYRLAELSSGTMVRLDHSTVLKGAFSSARVVYAPDASANVVTVSVPGQLAIANGDFISGPWGPVGDCYTVNPSESRLSAKVISSSAPGGLPALRLESSFDAACESQPISWHGGLLVVSLLVRDVQGSSPPRICLWEFGANRCASSPAIPQQTGWSTYSASIQPDTGTTAISLYLYADVAVPGVRSVTEYAHVRVISVAALPDFALVSDPPVQQVPVEQLVVIHSSFSSDWQASVNGKHVLVDGMLNGWLISTDSGTFSGVYKPASAFLAAQWISLAAFVCVLLLPILPWASRWLRTYVSVRSARR